MKGEAWSGKAGSGKSAKGPPRDRTIKNPGVIAQCTDCGTKRMFSVEAVRAFTSAPKCDKCHDGMLFVLEVRP